MGCGSILIAAKSSQSRGVTKASTNFVVSNSRWLIKFLTGLNQEYDSIRRDILKNESGISLEEAYGWVKREAARRSINTSSQSTDTDGGGANSTSGGGIGSGLAAQSHHPNSRGPPRPTAATHRSGSRPDKSRLVCSHCGKLRHTRENVYF